MLTYTIQAFERTGGDHDVLQVGDPIVWDFSFSKIVFLIEGELKEADVTASEDPAFFTFESADGLIKGASFTSEGGEELVGKIVHHHDHIDDDTGIFSAKQEGESPGSEES